MANRVVVLEGADGSGKTTLANELKDKYGFQIWHEGPPPEGRDQLQYYGGMLLKALRAKTPVVFDRLHLGESIYGPIMRNKDQLGYFGLRLINRICSAHGVPIIICLPPYETVAKNWRKKFAEGDDYVQSEKKIWDVYYRYKALSVYHTIFDYTHDFERQLYDLLNRVNEPRVDFPLNSVGRPTAKFLIVGERPGGELDCCFFSDKNSSGWLNQALWDAGYHEREMFFVNAFNIRSGQNDLFLVSEQLPNLKAVIALGSKASGQCRSFLKNGVQHLFASDYKPPIHDVAHPQYWKRFHSSRRDDYVKRLAEIRSKYVD